MNTLGYIEGTGLFKNDVLEQEVKDAIKSITGGLTDVFCIDGSYTISGLIVNDYEGWQEKFAEILQKYFVKADVETDVEGEKERFWINNGTVKAVMGNTVTYYEGFEDEFICQIPDKVLELIEKRIEKRIKEEGLL